VIDMTMSLRRGGLDARASSRRRATSPRTQSRNVLLSLAPVACLLLVAPEARAISFTSFGPNGEGGDINGQTMTIGSGGSAYEIDAFVNVSGSDLNGAATGTSAQLSLDPLPADLAFAFSTELSADGHDLLLSYELTNISASTLTGVTFLSFLDADIDNAINTYFDEYAVTAGSLAAGQNFEVDEPGYLFGDIYENLLIGSLDGTNAIPIGNPDDVSMALSFELAPLASGQKTIMQIMISEAGNSIGSFAIRQADIDPGSATQITYSGRAFSPAVPEPSAALLYTAGMLLVSVSLRGRRRRA
jgi:hypothetical protein